MIYAVASIIRKEFQSWKEENQIGSRLKGLGMVVGSAATIALGIVGFNKSANTLLKLAAGSVFALAPFAFGLGLTRTVSPDAYSAISGMFKSKA